jgi:hypothetical protein
MLWLKQPPKRRTSTNRDEYVVIDAATDVTDLHESRRTDKLWLTLPPMWRTPTNRRSDKLVVVAAATDVTDFHKSKTYEKWCG